MSREKPKRFETWMDGEAPFPPEVSRLLSKPILELALCEDVTGPWASEVEKKEYIAELAGRLREPVARELREAGMTVTEEDLLRICQVSASETFVIRRLNEGRLNGEILVQDFNHLPFYRTYQNYFEQTPDILAKALGISIDVTSVLRQTRRGRQKN